MKAIIEYGPFSTMIDVVGDHRNVYFPKPVDTMVFARIQDDVLMEATTHKLEFSYRADIEHHGQIIQIYRFVGES